MFIIYTYKIINNIFQEYFKKLNRLLNFSMHVH